MLCKAADELSYSVPEGFSSLIASTYATASAQLLEHSSAALRLADHNLFFSPDSQEVLMDAARTDAYEWFLIMRDICKQGAIAILAQYFLADLATAPSSPDDIVIPKRFRMDDLTAKILAHFSKNASVYEGHQGELDIDLEFFSASGIVKHSAAGAKGAKKAPKVDPIMLFDIFEDHRLSAFKEKFKTYFRNMEKTVSSSVFLVPFFPFPPCSDVHFSFRLTGSSFISSSYFGR